MRGKSTRPCLRGSGRSGIRGDGKAAGRVSLQYLIESATRHQRDTVARRSDPPTLFTSSPTGALLVALSPINPLIYLRVFFSLTSPPPCAHYPWLAQASVNQRSQDHPLFPTPNPHRSAPSGM